MARHRYPSSWRTARAVEVAAPTPGSTVIGPFGSNLVASDYRPHGVPVVFVRDVKEDGFEWKSEVYVEERKARELDAHRVDAGDLLATKMGLPPCIAASYPAWMPPGIVTADMIRLRPDPDHADVRWLVRAINGSDVRGQVRAITGGVTRPKVTLRDFRELRVPLPPLREQRQIAEVLDTVDEAIRRTEQIIAKLKQVKQGLLHDLLTGGIDDNGELRDPDRRPEQFKDSPLGRIPKGWEVVQLRDLADGGLVNGVFKEPGRAGRGIPLVNVGDLYQPFGIKLDRVERFDATDAEAAKYAVRPGDLFFTRSSLNLSGIAHCNVVREVERQAVFECHVMRIRPAEQVAPAFLALWCRSPRARAFLMGRAKQVTMTTISQPDIYPLPVPLPPKDEQHMMVESLDALATRIRSEAEVAEKLKRQKLGLMEDLLTGRIRVTPLLHGGGSGDG